MNKYINRRKFTPVLMQSGNPEGLTQTTIAIPENIFKMNAQNFKVIKLFLNKCTKL